MKVSTGFINRVFDAFKTVGISYVAFAGKTGFSLDRIHRIRQNRTIAEEEETKIIQLLSEFYPEQYETIIRIVNTV